MKKNNVPSCIGGEGMKERIHLYEPFFHHYYIDEILNALNIVAIATQQRLNRILELRAYMASAGATAELTRQTREADE